MEMVRKGRVRRLGTNDVVGGEIHHHVVRERRVIPGSSRPISGSDAFFATEPTEASLRDLAVTIWRVTALYDLEV
jgi:hypothetical protein